MTNLKVRWPHRCFLSARFAVCVLHVRVCVSGGVVACVRRVLNCVCRVITSSTVGSLFILRLTVYRLFSQNDLELIAPTFMCVNMGRAVNTHARVYAGWPHVCLCALSHARTADFGGDPPLQQAPNVSLHRAFQSACSCVAAAGEMMAAVFNIMDTGRMTGVPCFRLAVITL